MFEQQQRCSARQCRPWSTVRLACIVFIALLFQPAMAVAAILWDVENLLTRNAATVAGRPVALRDGESTGYVRIEHLRTLLEAHRRLGEVSRVNARLAIIVDQKPQATANFGQRLIVVTTGMLDIVGADPNMTAALLGHEFAHLSLRHAVQHVQNVPNIVLGAVAAAGAVSRQTGDDAAAARAGGVAARLLSASFSRQQEAEADKVGVEFLSSAKYDPNGVIHLMNTFLRMTGGKATGYLDTHPGFEERLSKATPAVVNQQYDASATTLAARKSWKALGELVDPWLKTQPNSARAWYYKGIALRGLRRSGALPAFEKAVAHEPNFFTGWLALCVELYRQGRHQDSLMCSEHIPRGELHDAYEAKTFQHPVYVGGLTGPVGMGEWDARVIRDVMKAR